MILIMSLMTTSMTSHMICMTLIQKKVMSRKENLSPQAKKIWDKKSRDFLSQIFVFLQFVISCLNDINYVFDDDIDDVKYDVGT